MVDGSDKGRGFGGKEKVKFCNCCFLWNLEIWSFGGFGYFEVAGDRRNGVVMVPWHTTLAVMDPHRIIMNIVGSVGISNIL